MTTRLKRSVDLLLLSLILIIGSTSPALSDPTLHIGVITPLSGSVVASGEAFRDGIILADELFDKGNKVEFIFEDDSFSPKKLRIYCEKIHRTEDRRHNDLWDATSFAVVPVTEQAKMPLAAVTIVDKVVQDKNFAVRHFVAWQEENKKIAEEVKKRGYKKVAIVTTVNDATLSLRDGFLKEPVEVVVNEEFLKDNLDFKSVAAKIKSARPDAVYHLLFAPQGSAFIKSLRTIGCNVPVFGVHNVEDPSEVKAAQGAYDGIWYVTGDDSAGSEYRKAYRTRFNKDPAAGWANGFDYALMMIQAAEKGIDVMTYLKTLKDFDGAFGHYGAAPGNTFDLKATAKIIRNGNFEYLGP